MYQLKSKILENINVRSNYFKLSFMAGPISKNAKPGQFIEVKVSDDLEPLLRKPFGVHKRPVPNIIEILYEVVGKGTEILSKRSPGEFLDVIGPLGNGFSYRTQGHKDTRTQVLIAGGIGVAPLVFLAQKLRDQRPKTKDRRPKTKDQRPIVLIGAKTKNAILCEKEFRDLGCDVRIATDDGSRGYKGFVTDLLKTLLQTPNSELTTLYACGPKAMLKEVAHISAKYRTPCQVLLEEYMACGVGACLGCAVKVKGLASYRVIGFAGSRKHANTQTRKHANYVYKMVCKDGPVFKADEVIWE